MGCDLRGIGVLVTRPERQAGSLCQRIAAQGGRPTLFPTLEIRESRDPETARTLLNQLEEYQIALFVSPNAVRWGLVLMGGNALPPGIKVGAVGKGTARALAEAGIEVSIMPRERFDSEALLSIPELSDVAGQRIIIFRGEGGRPLLGDTLRRRGAEVTYAEVYRRVRPQTDAGDLLRSWPSEIQIVTVTSNDILDNLAHILGLNGMPYLRRTPLMVISERMRRRAEELKCEKIICAPGADDGSLVDALCAWAASARRHP